jgi:preprotein translocase subunit YajC
MDESFISLEVAPNVSVRVQRQAISAVLPKGTLKSS